MTRERHVDRREPGENSETPDGHAGPDTPRTHGRPRGCVESESSDRQDGGLPLVESEDGEQQDGKNRDDRGEWLDDEFERRTEEEHRHGDHSHDLDDLEALAKELHHDTPPVRLGIYGIPV